MTTVDGYQKTHPLADLIIPVYPSRIVSRREQAYQSKKQGEDLAIFSVFKFKPNDISKTLCWLYIFDNSLQAYQPTNLGRSLVTFSGAKFKSTDFTTIKSNNKIEGELVILYKHWYGEGYLPRSMVNSWQPIGVEYHDHVTPYNRLVGGDYGCDVMATPPGDNLTRQCFSS